MSKSSFTTVRRPVVRIYTDGGCSPNPGPGGWGAVVEREGERWELCGGFLETTNNRMELAAVLFALSSLSEPSHVTVHSDSTYVVHAMSKGWIDGWIRKGWVTSDRKPVKNRDLWEKLLALRSVHVLDFRWLKGHAGHAENERCDQLVSSARSSARAIDTGYTR